MSITVFAHHEGRGILALQILLSVSLRSLNRLFRIERSLETQLQLQIHVSLQFSCLVNVQLINIELQLLRRNVPIIYYLPDSLQRVSRQPSDVLSQLLLLCNRHSVKMNRSDWFLFFQVRLRNIILRLTFDWRLFWDFKASDWLDDHSRPLRNGKVRTIY